MFSFLSSITLICGLMRERLTSTNLFNEVYGVDDENRKFITKIVCAFGIVLQLTSVIILSVINGDAVGDTKLKLDFVNFHPLELGTPEDVDAMVQILATYSTSYNWLVTCCVSIIILLHNKR